MNKRTKELKEPKLPLYLHHLHSPPLTSLVVPLIFGVSSWIDFSVKYRSKRHQKQNLMTINKSLIYHFHKHTSCSLLLSFNRRSSACLALITPALFIPLSKDSLTKNESQVQQMVLYIRLPKHVQSCHCYVLPRIQQNMIHALNANVSGKDHLVMSMGK
jgi:hypothetical protein